MHCNGSNHKVYLTHVPWAAVFLCEKNHILLWYTMATVQVREKGSDEALHLMKLKFMTIDIQSNVTGKFWCYRSAHPPTVNIRNSRVNMTLHWTIRRRITPKKHNQFPLSATNINPCRIVLCMKQNCKSRSIETGEHFVSDYSISMVFNFDGSQSKTGNKISLHVCKLVAAAGAAALLQLSFFVNRRFKS